MGQAGFFENNIDTIRLEIKLPELEILLNDCRKITAAFRREGIIINYTNVYRIMKCENIFTVQEIILRK